MITNVNNKAKWSIKFSKLMSLNESKSWFSDYQSRLPPICLSVQNF